MTSHLYSRRAPILLLLVPATLFAAADGAKVVTKRGTATVTLGDVDAYVEVIPTEQRAGFVDSGERVEKMLENLLLSEQLANSQREAEKAKGVDPLLTARLRFVENEARAQYYLATMRADAPRVDAKALAREAYALAPEQFRLPDTFDLRHVLVKTGDRSEPAARELIDQVHADAVAHPDQFAELAKKYSEDQSNRDKGGLLAGVDLATLTPNFAAAAQALTRPGEISPVVQTPFGLHVIQLAERHPGKERSFESVQAELEAKVMAEAAGRWAQREIERLQNIPAQTDDAVANSIRTRYGGPVANTP
jgi:peptidyl-prolyl cis-trans isomerase C